MNPQSVPNVQVFVGVMLTLLGLIVISDARFAYLHHTIVWWRQRGHDTWLYPGQAMLGGALLLLVGTYCLADAIIRKMRW
jgi:hypothetical protein